jgi:hypothetical protein
MQAAMDAQRGAPKKPCGFCERVRRFLGLPASAPVVMPGRTIPAEDADKLGLIVQTFNCAKCGAPYTGHCTSMYALCPACEKAFTTFSGA